MDYETLKRVQDDIYGVLVQLPCPLLSFNLERSIFVELDRLLRTLADAGPAFNTFFWMDRIRFILVHLIDFTGTDLNTVATTRAYISIHYGIHNK